MAIDLTTISVSKKLKDKLERMKVHPNQSFNDVVVFAIDQYLEANQNSKPTKPKSKEEARKFLNQAFGTK